MKKILSLIMVTPLIFGCTPSRSEMQEEINDLTSKLYKSEETIKLLEHEVELLCGLTAEIGYNGLIKYVGNNTFIMPNGNVMTFDSLPEECLQMLSEYEKAVLERATILGLKDKE